MKEKTLMCQTVAQLEGVAREGLPEKVNHPAERAWQREQQMQTPQGRATWPASLRHRDQSTGAGGGRQDGDGTRRQDMWDALGRCEDFV